MRLTRLTLLVLVAHAPALAQAPGTVLAGQTTITLPDTSNYSLIARHLLALEVARSAAIARHDTTWLSNLYAPDFRGVPANGALVDRATLLGVFTRDNPNSRFLIDELVIRDFGTAASVMGRLRTTTLAGEVVAESRYVHLYISRDKHWWIVNAVGSPVQKPAPRGG
jgi:hypothetical protein